MRTGKTAILTADNFNVEVEAPIVTLTGGFIIICIFITAFIVFLLTTRRLKLIVQKTSPYPKYYLSEAILYILGQEDKFPSKSLVLMIENLRDANLIKTRAVLLAKLVIYFLSIIRIPQSYRYPIINKIFKWIKGELLIG